MDYQTRIRQFVISNFYVADASSLGDDASLLDLGIIDSTGVLEVVGFLETEFGVQVLDEEMLPENLDSLASITRFVERKIAAA
jgi:acyl carrier protein